MKLSFNRDKALQDLGPLQGLMGARSMLPILSHVIIESGPHGVRVIASDLEIWMSCQFEARVEEEGSITIPGRRFLSIVRELPGLEATLETGDNNTSKILCQRSFFQMSGMSREEFPAQPDMGKTTDFRIKQATLRNLIRRTSYAVSQDETRYVLNGLYLLFAEGKISAVATDGRRLALAESELEMDKDVKKDVIIPSKTVMELARILGDEGDLTIKLGTNQAAFEFPLIFLITRLIDGKFPSYQQVIPKQTKEKVKLPRLEFLQVVKRASLLTSEKSNSVKFSFNPGLLKVSAITPEVGEAREEMNVDYGGEPLEIAFNPHYIMDVLKALEEEESVQLEMIDSSNPGVIRVDGDFLCIIMPMKLN